LRVARDLVELDTPDSVRSQVPAVGSITQREPLIE
jgi:hypothetical protein